MYLKLLRLLYSKQNRCKFYSDLNLSEYLTKDSKLKIKFLSTNEGKINSIKNYTQYNFLYKYIYSRLFELSVLDKNSKIVEVEEGEITLLGNSNKKGYVYSVNYSKNKYLILTEDSGFFVDSLSNNTYNSPIFPGVISSRFKDLVKDRLESYTGFDYNLLEKHLSKIYEEFNSEIREYYNSNNITNYIISSKLDFMNKIVVLLELYNYHLNNHTLDELTLDFKSSFTTASSLYLNGYVLANGEGTIEGTIDLLDYMQIIYKLYELCENNRYSSIYAEVIDMINIQSNTAVSYGISDEIFILMHDYGYNSIFHYNGEKILSEYDIAVRTKFYHRSKSINNLFYNFLNKNL
jgi:inosine/xanthosine triphosphate pyrophosphatase family protein